MIRRMFYLSLGATAGVLLMRRANKLVESLSPENLLAVAAATASEFLAEIRAGMAERETELRQALGLDDSGAKALTVSSRQAIAGGER